MRARDAFFRALPQTYAWGSELLLARSLSAMVLLLGCCRATGLAPRGRKNEADSARLQDRRRDQRPE